MAIGAARWTAGKRHEPASDVQEREGRAQAVRQRVKAKKEDQAWRLADGERRDAQARAEGTPASRARMSAARAQLERVRRAQEQARASGDIRRAAELGHRAQRIGTQIEGEAKLAHGRAARAEHPEQMRERERFLDEQAMLPSAVEASRRRASGQAPVALRDYAALAGLASSGRVGYERLDAARQRAVRVQVDRELAFRRGLDATASELAAQESPALGPRATRTANLEFDRALEQRMRRSGRRMPTSQAPRSAFDAWRAAAGREGRPGSEPESSVMRDAREVAARRKRQLGRDRR
jgi:hypothetical protein